MHRPNNPIEWVFVAFLSFVVAILGWSLVMASIGAGRLAVPMGYAAKYGYAVGATFDLGKDILLVVVLRFWRRRSLGFVVGFGIAWICLVTLSGLATHSTVSTAISTIERSGTWKMEVRNNAKAELATREQQLATLSRPSPPRPAKTVREALAAASVPPAIWRNSNECNSIRESAYFTKACAQVAQLRRELAAAQDFERLSARATELREILAQAPIVPTSDPLPASFNATLGRWLPFGGTDGVPLLYTMVVEIVSCLGLAGLEKLRHGRKRNLARGSLTVRLPRILKGEGGSPPGMLQTLPKAQKRTLPKPSLRAATPTPGRVRPRTTGEGSHTPSNIHPIRLHPPYAVLLFASSAGFRGTSVKELSADTSHVAVFAGERLRSAPGTSVSSKDLRAAYDEWCASRRHVPLSPPKFAEALEELGYTKWKSCGRMRYRDLELITMFDHVLEAANLRLGPMSRGRYMLVRETEGRGNARRGLALSVDDAHTGRQRPASTLSGGETFIAALALALGLSDIVESTRGNVRLDTIFIDEGFGSLDSDSDGGGTLEQVLETLQDLVGQNRAVGLISHVPLVQQAIPNGFWIAKTASGSQIVMRS